MRRNAILITLLASEIFVLIFGALFYFLIRPSVASAFSDFGTPMPPLTRAALSPWLLPPTGAASLALSLIALAAPIRRSYRNALAGAGLVIVSVALVVAVWGALERLFGPA